MISERYRSEQCSECTIWCWNGTVPVEVQLPCYFSCCLFVSVSNVLADSIYSNPHLFCPFFNFLRASAGYLADHICARSPNVLNSIPNAQHTVPSVAIQLVAHAPGHESRFSYQRHLLDRSNHSHLISPTARAVITDVPQIQSFRRLVFFGTQCL